MHELVFFSLVIMTLLRVVGVGVSLDFYLNTKDFKFQLISLGWLLSLIAGVLPILAALAGSEFLADLLYLGNGLCVTTGSFFIFVGIYSYFRGFSNTKVILLTLFMIVGPVLLFTVSPHLSTMFSVFGAYIIAFVMFFFPLANRREFKEIVGEGVRWFYVLFISFICLVALSVFQYTQGYSYGLYESTNVVAIMINYSVGIGLVILMLNLVIRFEHSISAIHKDRLKDEYSHKLGNLLQIITGLVYMVAHPEESTAAATQKNKQLIQEKLEEAAALLKEIRRL